MKANNIHIQGISPKEQEIICLLALFTLLTRQHIQTILEHKNHSKIFIWLRSLEENGFIKQLPMKRDNSIIFYLLPKGIQIAKKLILENTISLTKNVSLLTIDRYLSIADVYTQLKQYVEPDFSFFTKVNFPFKIFTITPDAYLTYSYQDKAKTYFIDLDRETQSIFVMKKKFEKYSQYYYSYHWKKFTLDYFPAVCFVTTTEERKRKLLKLAEELFKTPNFAPIVFKFTTLDELLKKTPQENICIVPFEKEKYSFL